MEIYNYELNRRIPLKWLEEWARITDNEELIDVLIKDWRHDILTTPYWTRKEESIEDDVVLHTYNIDANFEPECRNHYEVKIVATDWDETGNNRAETVEWQGVQFFNRGELEKWAREQVLRHLKDHHEISCIVYPYSFSCCRAFHDRHRKGKILGNTKVAEDGQIGFRL